MQRCAGQFSHFSGGFVYKYKWNCNKFAIRFRICTSDHSVFLGGWKHQATMVRRLIVYHRKMLKSGPQPFTDLPSALDLNNGVRSPWNFDVLMYHHGFMSYHIISYHITSVFLYTWYICNLLTILYLWLSDVLSFDTFRTGVSHRFPHLLYYQFTGGYLFPLGKLCCNLK